MGNSRRDFFKHSSAAFVAAMLAKNPLLAKEIENMTEKPPKNQIPKRKLGNTGINLSIIGFGGIVVKDEPQELANKVVADAVEAGINYFDVAPGYGTAEEILGPALKPFRDEVFLACKTHLRTAETAKKSLDDSLRLLKTDHFDLFQFHNLSDMENDVKATLAKDGALKTVLEAKKAGIVKYIGFSSHDPDSAIYAMENFDFDTILYPINFTCHYIDQFDQRVLETARRRNVAIFALKSMAKQKWLDEEEKKNWPKTWYEPILDPDLARKALYWTLSQPGVIAAVPPGTEKLFRLAVSLAGDYRPTTDEENNELKKIATELAPIFG